MKLHITTDETEVFPAEIVEEVRGIVENCCVGENFLPKSMSVTVCDACRGFEFTLILSGRYFRKDIGRHWVLRGYARLLGGEEEDFLFGFLVRVVPENEDWYGGLLSRLSAHNLPRVGDEQPGSWAKYNGAN